MSEEIRDSAFLWGCSTTSLEYLFKKCSPENHFSGTRNAEPLFKPFFFYILSIVL